MIEEIIKWVLIVFAAGFIGYFGRKLAMLILDRKKSVKTKEDYKLEKKKLKLEKKKLKS